MEKTSSNELRDILKGSLKNKVTQINSKKRTKKQEEIECVNLAEDSEEIENTPIEIKKSKLECEIEDEIENTPQTKICNDNFQLNSDGNPLSNKNNDEVQIDDISIGSIYFSDDENSQDQKYPMIKNIKKDSEDFDKEFPSVFNNVDKFSGIITTPKNNNTILKQKNTNSVSNQKKTKSVPNQKNTNSVPNQKSTNSVSIKKNSNIIIASKYVTTSSKPLETDERKPEKKEMVNPSIGNVMTFEYLEIKSGKSRTNKKTTYNKNAKYDNSNLIFKSNNESEIEKAHSEIYKWVQIIEYVSKLSMDELRIKTNAGELNFDYPNTNIVIATISADPGSTNCGFAICDNLTEEIVGVDCRRFRGEINEDLSNDEIIENVLYYMQIFKHPSIQFVLENQKTALFQNWDHLKSNNKIDRKVLFEAQAVQTVMQTYFFIETKQQQFFKKNYFLQNPNEIKKHFDLPIINSKFMYEGDKRELQRKFNKKNSVKKFNEFATQNVQNRVNHLYAHKKDDISDAGLGGIQYIQKQKGKETKKQRTIVDSFN